MQCREVTGATIVLLNPRDRLTNMKPIREGYGPAKIAWDLGQRSDIASLMPWNPNAARFQDGDTKVQGENYGQRIAGFLDEAITLIKDDPNSRRAWVPIWQPFDLINDYTGEHYDGNNHAIDTLHPSRTSSNVPCTLGFGIRIVDDLLVMQAVMRSQSVWGVMPYDVFLLTVLQELIANTIGVELGWYEHTMLNGHFYQREEADIHGALASAPEPPEAMAPINKTLAEAEATWPTFLDAMNNGVDATPTDPIEQLLLANRTAEVHA
jgi:thymidylate synthase